MDAINSVASQINQGIAYLKINAWPIAFLLALWFYVRPQVLLYLDNAWSQRSPEKVKDHDRDLRRVRQLQQLQAEQDAKLNAEELRKRKEERMQEEKAQAKKRTAAINKTKSGTSSLSMDSFTTPSYRPQRRTVRKG